MDTLEQDHLPTPVTTIETPGGPEVPASALSRRGFLRTAALAGGGLGAVAGLAACGHARTGAAWTFGPPFSPAPSGAAPAGSAGASAVASAGASPAATHDMSASPGPAASAPPVTGTIPDGWTSHDVEARDKVRRYVGDLAPALKDIYPPAVVAKLAAILGVGDDYPQLHQKPAFAQVPQVVLSDVVSPLKPEVVGGVKVFKLTVDEIEAKIDELLPPVAGLGFNKSWPGPTIRVNQGDKVRAEFTNNLKETTGIHFHGVEFDDFFQDGVPFVTQKPIVPGETFAYKFTANNAGSLMYHSHHNATDQVGRGLLGAFIVEAKEEPVEADREYIWISNDELGGFTINGHGFPAVVPVLAAVGEKVRIRFMNEGIMMHPWHLHGYPMTVVARDGYYLGQNAYQADTVTVGPGERWDVNITLDRLGLWAYH